MQLISVFISIFLDPALDIGLSCTGHGKRFCRDIFGNCGTGSSKGPFPNMDRSDQIRIAADKGMIIDGAAMFILPVKINGYRAAAEINVFTKV